MNIYYENPQFATLPYELQNQICKYLPQHPILVEYKRMIQFSELLHVAIVDLLIINMRYKDYCAKNNVIHTKVDSYIVMCWVKQDIVYLMKHFNIFEVSRFQQFQDDYIKLFGVPAIPPFWTNISL